MYVCIIIIIIINETTVFELHASLIAFHCHLCQVVDLETAVTLPIPFD